MGTSTNITGIILAGGKARRMGQEKGLTIFNKKALIEYAIEALSPLCEQIIISSNTDVYDQYPYQIISDENPGIGPMGGILSCLKNSETEKTFLLSCDMPFITPEVVQFILNKSEGLASVPWYQSDHYEPMCGFYHRDIIPVLEKYISEGNYKLPNVFEDIEMNRIDAEEIIRQFHPHVFFNINSPQNLIEATSIFEKLNSTNT